MMFRMTLSSRRPRLKAAVDGDRSKDHAQHWAQSYASHWQPSAIEMSIFSHCLRIKDQRKGYQISSKVCFMHYHSAISLLSSLRNSLT